MGDTSTIDNFTFNQKNWTQDGTIAGSFAVFKNANSDAGISKPVDVKAGHTYTYSVFAKADKDLSNTGTDLTFHALSPFNSSTAGCLTDLSGNLVDSIHWGTKNVDTSWKRYFVIFRCIKDCTIYPRCDRSLADTTIYVAAPQLVEGTQMLPVFKQGNLLHRPVGGGIWGTRFVNY